VTPIATARAKFAAGVSLSLSKFEDAQAGWAKSLPDTARLRLLFADATEVYLEVADWHALSRAHQALVKAAPSRLADDP
jgi:hypothetical protein